MELADYDGLNLRQLSIKAGVPYNTVYAIVKRKSNRVQWETLERIAAALGTTAAFLKSGDNEVNTDLIQRRAEQLRQKDNAVAYLHGNLRFRSIPDMYLRDSVEEAEADLLSIVHEICGMDEEAITEDTATGAIYQKWNPEKIRIVKEYLFDGKTQIRKLISAALPSEQKNDDSD